MKKLTLLLELAPWLKSFSKWFGSNYILTLVCLAIIIVVFILLNRIFSKRHDYESLNCIGYVSRAIEGTEIKTVLHKDVPVRIYKGTGMYFFQDLDHKWYRLRKIHRMQIDKSRENGVPEFDIPKRKKNKK